MVLSFVKILEKFLGVQMTKLSVRKLWEDDPPVEAQGKSLEEFLEKVGLESCLIEFSQY